MKINIANKPMPMLSKFDVTRQKVLQEHNLNFMRIPDCNKKYYIFYTFSKQ